MRVLINVVDTLSIERGRATLDPMHLIPFLEEKLREVGAVLACYPCDQRTLRHQTLASVRNRDPAGPLKVTEYYRLLIRMARLVAYPTSRKSGSR